MRHLARQFNPLKQAQIEVEAELDNFKVINLKCSHVSGGGAEWRTVQGQTNGDVVHNMYPLLHALAALDEVELVST